MRAWRIPLANRAAARRAAKRLWGVSSLLWPEAARAGPPGPAQTLEHGAVSDRRWSGFLTLAAGTALLALALVAARVAWFDAYWLFREAPPWVAATGGANKLIDRQTRRAKSLQALTRTYRIALIGSSTTYHGLDPDDLDEPLRSGTLNLGISAVLADELATVAALVAARRQVERVLIGLDYYMFSRDDVPVRLDPGLATPSGRWRALLGSVLSQDALDGSWFREVEGAGDPGAWKRNGFRVTPPLPPALTRANDAVRRRTASAYRPETLAHLERALDRLAGRAVSVYVTPVSDAQRRVLADAGLLEDFERWRRDVGRVAEARGARFADLADLGAAHPFDPAQGSTPIWLDNLHYTPLLGARIFERLGLPVRRQPEVGGTADTGD